MSAAQLTFPIKFDFDTRSCIRLGAVERLFYEEKILNPAPCRNTIIRWVEEGRLEGKKTPMGYWVIYQDSLERFVRELYEVAA